ncbi:MAG TPA: type II toxin-antitoxin system antitoxin SocA domain-containing protein [Candidatus Baltobacteraceae bacterium]
MLDVAQFILDEKQSAIATMKLQKLCYYAQAWTLVWTGTPLFDEDFQAWRDGPVCPELYESHRGQYSVSTIPGARPERLTANQRTMIQSVLKAYSPFSGDQLSTLTHLEDPWRLAREGVEDGDRSQRPISKPAMRAYYLQRKERAMIQGQPAG